MSYSPAGIWNPSVGVITPWSAESIGVGLMSSAATNAPAAASWPSGNLAVYVPFELGSAVSLTGALYYSNAASGNYDVGVYTSGGTRLVSKGSTALASGFNVASMTTTLLQPGRYYMALALSATQSFYRVAATTPIDAALGVKQQSSALALPSNATLADAANGYIPAFGIVIAGVNP